jgi:L-amino acid N-acyltransferase YncA
MRGVIEPGDVTLRDGRTVHLRAVLPSDEEEVLQAFDRMDSDARYMRFMTAKRSANVERLREVLASFPEKGFMIAATVPAPDGIDIVASATCMIAADPNACEFAITVLGPWGGAGLGRALMEALIGAARARGLTSMHGYILAANQPMLRLASRLGFQTARDPDDPLARLVSLDLRSDYTSPPTSLEKKS